MSDPDQVEAAAEAVEREFGPIDVWVNAAMVTVFAPVEQTEPAEYRRVTEVTYLGYVHGTLAALRRMKPRDRGTIVQVGSALAYRSIPLQSAYCAAKARHPRVHRLAALELIHDGSNVHITMVQMPALNTPQFEWGRSKLPRKAQPVPPIYQPEVAAEAIVWAAHHHRRESASAPRPSRRSSATSVAPGFGDWYAARTAYEGQQTGEPENPSRPDNLYDPVDADGDFGAHGPFDGEARTAQPCSSGPTRIAAGWRWPRSGSRGSPARRGSQVAGTAGAGGSRHWEERTVMIRDTARIDRVRRVLEAADLDAILATIPAHVLLLTGYWPVVGNALALATRDGRTAVIAPQDEQELAEGGWADEVRTFEPVSPEEMKPLEEAVSGPLAEVGRSFGLDRGWIGYARGPVSEPASYAAMSLYGPGLVELLQQALPSAHPVPADEPFRRLEAVKTPRRWPGSG